MASKFARDIGFEEERFEFPVSNNFKCAICLNVLNNPKSCRNNQHFFCFGCIGQHLEVSHTCPECMDELTPATLIQPPRVLLNCILELRIKCSYNNRGCSQYIQLDRLQNHVEQCGFAPAKCGNEGCGAEMNKRDKRHHESELCKFRKVECYGCGKLRKEMQEFRRNQEKVKKNTEETRKEMDRKQREMSEKQREMDRKMATMLENQGRMKEGIREMRIAMVSSLDKMENILNDAQIDSPSAQITQASYPQISPSPLQFRPQINRDVIVMGGGDKDYKISNSVEKFCCKNGKWVDLASMIVPHKSASSAVHDNQVIVSGGYTDSECVTDRNELTDSSEILNLDQCPLKWVMSKAKLPVPLCGHQTFVYKGKLIVVCKYSKTEKDGRGRNLLKDYRNIYEILLIPPYTAKELYSLPRLSLEYRAELVKDKLFIFGVNSQSDVKIYDLDKKECREMPSLPYPYPVRGMTTVQWSNYVVLLGGDPKDNLKKSEQLKSEKIDTIKYNTITGESETLAPMNYVRIGCTAAVTDDVIIVMGGYSSVNSVECFSFHTNTWQALPVMRERRYLATAVVSPI